MSYDFKKIEKKWQDFWDENKTFYTDVWDFLIYTPMATLTFDKDWSYIC